MTVSQGAASVSKAAALLSAPEHNCYKCRCCCCHSLETNGGHCDTNLNDRCNSETLHGSTLDTNVECVSQRISQQAVAMKPRNCTDRPQTDRQTDRETSHRQIARKHSMVGRTSK